MSFATSPRFATTQHEVNAIVKQHAKRSTLPHSTETEQPTAPATGIRKTNTGEWAVICEGRFVDSFRGIGARARAIDLAGTNHVLA